MTTTIGICTDQNQPYDTLTERWRMFEELGFDSVWDTDHFNQPSQPTGPLFEGWTLLSALAVHTTSIRIGVLVSSNTFRHPALLAQQAMTVDHVSSGRLTLGIGCGWYEGEHQRMGIEFDTPPERVDRFREAVEIVDSLLRNETTTYNGEYYQLDQAYVRPGPVQRPRPPLMLRHIAITCCGSVPSTRISGTRLARWRRWRNATAFWTSTAYRLAVNRARFAAPSTAGLQR